ncbi:hypothetical protein LCGC14_1717310 [marine sediment metagenome]|uniref:Uncharacterized protein n=1 Tax=marine sediment metagenome TaxID=412755 RepID=A0A0F9I128_9ZZZZ
MSSLARECNCSNKKSHKAYFPGNEPPSFVCKKCVANAALMFGAEKITALKTGGYE